MNKKIGLIVIACIVTAVIVWQGWSLWAGQSTVTADQVREQVQAQYSGDVVDIVEGDERFFISLQIETGDYELEVSKESGEIIRMTRVSEGTQDPKTEPSGEDSSEEPQPTEPITEQEALSIALAEVDGQVDDVDYESEDGEAFFLIEIERGEDREATVQVHAITGEILSITWDD
ncbi:PepSY domain-containing protein [Halobacillus litoralis]|uniref:PepSY domain-containing protein n=1 Tax=Halobacillus litoralis TaxID=45668 RepID=UPI001CD3CE0B|nr:PepSY domain-containing protein [Halobacillus litoralis]MCA0970560.1 PepSY domain-containing protein [Halobacillus litoralis]